MGSYDSFKHRTMAAGLCGEKFKASGFVWDSFFKVTNEEMPARLVAQNPSMLHLKYHNFAVRCESKFCNNNFEVTHVMNSRL